MKTLQAEVVEVEISVEMTADGSPVVDHLGDTDFCRLSWARGAGPPPARGVYFWLSDDYRVFYVGKATSNELTASEGDGQKQTALGTPSERRYTSTLTSLRRFSHLCEMACE